MSIPPLIQFIVLLMLASLIATPISAIARAPAFLAYAMHQESKLKVWGILLAIFGGVLLVAWSWVWGANCALVTHRFAHRGTDFAWLYYVIGFVYSFGYPPSLLPPIAFLIACFLPDPKTLPLIFF